MAASNAPRKGSLSKIKVLSLTKEVWYEQPRAGAADARSPGTPAPSVLLFHRSSQGTICLHLMVISWSRMFVGICNVTSMFQREGKRKRTKGTTPLPSAFIKQWFWKPSFLCLYTFHLAHPWPEPRGPHLAAERLAVMSSFQLHTNNHAAPLREQRGPDI